MLFNSHVFIFGFLPLTAAVYHLLRRRQLDRIAIAWLGLMSLGFYGWWAPGYLLLLIALMAANFALVHYLVAHGGRRPAVARAVLAAGIAGNLAVLGYFKYSGFLVDNLRALAGLSLSWGAIVLPLGISFFTFQKIALLVDAYRGRVRQLDPSGYVLFVAFFPQLIAGPIVHHSEVMPQFAQRGRVALGDIALGLSIFVIGLAKKALLADQVAHYASPAFDGAAAGTMLSCADAWIGALAYTLQLYFDFSGYSDMAVGAALLFGIRLPLNFASPYKAESITDFWRRWHMTLSRFLRDYLYIPLGGNRKGPTRRYVNLLLTMLLGGLWHGAGWTFVAWGALHGFYLVVHHGWQAVRGHIRSRRPGAPGRLALLGRMATFLAVVIGWVLFRSSDLATAGRMLESMVGLGGAARLSALAGPAAPTVILFLLGVVWLAPNTQELTGYRPAGAADVAATAGPHLLRWRLSPGWAMAVGGLFAAGVLSLTRISEFLYFQF